MSVEPVTRREAILAELERRLKLINHSDDDRFETFAGQAVFVAEVPTLGEDDEEEAIAIVPAPDEPGFVGEHVMVDWPIEIQALVNQKWEEPWRRAERILGDIKKAIETADRTLGGTLGGSQKNFRRGPTRIIAREEGQTSMGVGVFYSASFAEQWGNP